MDNEHFESMLANNIFIVSVLQLILTKLYIMINWISPFFNNLSKQM